mmetsp:Transcript_14986/g.47687  ORF Transcript_14986/g.47687 Transcript_14986/m.47687 type:complete len:119 (-) Transcript_14986:184-540(-)
MIPTIKASCPPLLPCLSLPHPVSRLLPPRHRGPTSRRLQHQRHSQGQRHRQGSSLGPQSKLAFPRGEARAAGAGCSALTDSVPSSPRVAAPLLHHPVYGTTFLPVLANTPPSPSSLET